MKDKNINKRDLSCNEELEDYLNKYKLTSSDDTQIEIVEIKLFNDYEKANDYISEWDKYYPFLLSEIREAKSKIKNNFDEGEEIPIITIRVTHCKYCSPIIEFKSYKNESILDLI